MIRILTDSAADLTERELCRPGVAVVPMAVTFADGSTYEDDGTMTKDEFYARLASDAKLPRTSQPSPAAFMQAYADAAEAGDEVLVITIAQTLSGTFQCANLAAAEADCPVTVVDSETAAQGESILVREALRLREQGCTAAEIAAQLDILKKRVRIIAVVDSLKHLQKGGRIPAAVALVGGALGIKPVLRCMAARSAWRTRAAVVRARWWRCSSCWKRWAALTPTTAIPFCTVTTASWSPPCTTTCTTTCI